jgi:hypothetical protein
MSATKVTLARLVQDHTRAETLLESLALKTLVEHQSSALLQTYFQTHSQGPLSWAQLLTGQVTRHQSTSSSLMQAKKCAKDHEPYPKPFHLELKKQILPSILLH